MPTREKETWKMRVETNRLRERERGECETFQRRIRRGGRVENQFDVDPYSRNVKYPLAWISRPSSGRLG
jgi:hypothetical protein